MHTDRRYETTNLVVEHLRELLDAAGLQERANPIRGITVDNPVAAKIVRDVLRGRPAPTKPELREWWSIALHNLEWLLENETSVRAAA